MTNYQLSKLINFRLEQEGLKPVTSQQVYNARKGAPLLDGQAALVYVETYVARRATGSTVKSIDPAEWFAEMRAEGDPVS